MITPLDIENKKFSKKMINGYSTEEVDDFLDEVTSDYEKIYKEATEARTKIQEIEERRNAKKRQYETLADKFKKLCSIKFDIKEKIENYKKNTTVYNWESQTLYISILQDKIGKIDMQLDEILDKMNIIKNS